MTTIVEKTSDGVIYRAAKKYPIPDVDLLTLLFDSEHCLAKPDTPVHISAADPSLILTTSRARSLTQATSASLRKHFGIGANGKGKDICSVISTGHYLLPVLSYGIIGSGGVFSAASAASTPSELSKQLQGAQSKILVTVEATKETAVKAAEEAGWGANGGGRVLLMSEDKDWELKIIEKDGKLGSSLIVENDQLPWQKITDPWELENSLVILIYSSGTTGLPKEPWLIFQSLTSAGIQGYLINPFYMGGPVYWMPRFDFAQFLAYNAKYKITFFFTVPPIYLLIAKSPCHLQHAASQKLGGPDCFISQTWGLSETTGSATIMPMGMSDDTGSVSPLIPNMLARIVDDNGSDVEPGQPGEVLVKGPVVCKGYYQNPAANKEAFTNDWFHTGDIAEFRNGLFYIVDRKKELIKYKGLQVAPAELEALLLNHPDILDAAVIGVDVDDGTNEVPRAYVVADQGKISAEEIREFVKRNVAGHKQLRGGRGVFG
ncbi:hypothetical protein SNOG_15618 [Parastagonospora nodorum SN15]|uniref:AMP-dependent synthetase/ligase domain-containing protein n=1 Tax=Phaeosphaeria nodorum (strain SN15 / ATCC MYA-4574 / FGSC 10173) TaxID=321614 RepID=Q0TXY3_PHANO|nr:hypothetical protein SNOG_15618 [Parastagonospora nodorum SN15]EAT76993.2 hypothetical protein SNOG_15618 [Parastagonospora nodorum SN15]